MRILAYGDSNTFGSAPAARMGAGAILPKGRRWADVMAVGLPQAEVIVEGLPGRTTVFPDPVEGAHLDGLAVLPAILGSHRPIDLFILCLGTNDLKARFGLRAFDVAKGAARVLLAAKASGHVDRMLCIAPPEPKAAGDHADMFHDVAARGAGLAGHMARFAEEAGAHFLDAGAFISVDRLDGIHWSEDSHARLGLAVTAKVGEIWA